MALAVPFVAVLLGVVGWVGVSATATPELPVYSDAPAFALTTQDGATMTGEELRGRVWLASVLFTQCTEACPVLMPRLVALQRHLGQQGLLGGRATLVTFSADPDRDSPHELRTYADAYGADLSTWTFLTGDPEAVRSVIEGGFKLGVGQVGLELHVHDDGTEHQHYNVIHSTRVVLVDAGGRVRAYYQGLEVAPEQVARDLRRLVGGRWPFPLRWPAERKSEPAIPRR